MANLQEKIENLNKNLSSQLPEVIMNTFAESIAELKKTNIESSALKIGNRVSPFSLNSVNGTIINSDILFKEFDKIVLVFFRGSWCPYCNLELKELQETLDQIQSKKVKLLALSPQLPQYSLALSMENHLKFDIIHDKDNVFTKKMGVSFKLQNFALPHYKQLGIDLKEYNGNDENTLPIPAVFIIDNSYVITYSYVDSNYMNRVDIDELIMNL